MVWLMKCRGPDITKIRTNRNLPNNARRPLVGEETAEAGMPAIRGLGEGFEVVADIGCLLSFRLIWFRVICSAQSRFSERNYCCANIPGSAADLPEAAI